MADGHMMVSVQHEWLGKEGRVFVPTATEEHLQTAGK